MKKIIKSLIALDATWKELKTSIVSEDNLKTIINQLVTEQQPITEENYTALTSDFGVYVFYIKPTKPYTLKTLLKDWEETEYRNFPKVVKTRFSNYSVINTDEIYPFYIGKSEKLASRIKQHITHNGKTSTYSLKLNGRDFFNAENITFSYWKLPVELKECSNEIKQFFITQIENALREKLNPWIGKQ